jgi:tyrosinase
VVAPYWNWAFDSQAPHLSLIFSDNFMGGNGRAGGCVTNGKFSGWRVSYPAPHCLQRSFDAGNRINSFYSSDVITRAISQARDYDALRRAIEFAPSGSVHVGIGGDMALMQAPNDPIFWLHIAYLDKIWSRWQQIRPQNAISINGPLVGGTTINTTTVIPGLKSSYKVGDVLDTKKLCYDYAELPASTATSKP